MIKVTFTKTVSLFAGLIGLTAGQVKHREPFLKEVKKGLYDITGKIEFKAGETIGLESVPKPMRALLDVRLRNACELLKTRPDLNVTQVALSSGFNDPAYFTRQFRELTGQPPLRWRCAMISKPPISKLNGHASAGLGKRCPE